MTKTLLVISIMLITLQTQAQNDTTFWFAAPDVSSFNSYDRPIMFRISALQQPATVTISQPANGGMPIQTFLLPANSTQSIDLTSWINSIECAPGNIIQNKGLKITATSKISIYYEVNTNGPNPEIFALKGKNALGNQFYISSQYLLSNTASHLPVPISSFNIVATDDNTVVTINPTKNIIGHNANIPFIITLNKGQTYAAIATSTLASQHLQGSLVNATKPIAITLADDLLQGIEYGGICEDIVGDQTVPVNVTGTEYIAFKSNLNSPYDKVYITATQNNTSVMQDGVVVTSLSAGQSVELPVINATTYIQLSAPAYAYEMSGVTCEVGSAILPKINCTGSSSVSVVRSTVESFYITLLVKSGGQGNFLINNQPGVITAAQFNTIPNTSGQWYGARISLSLANYPNGNVINIKNTSNIFQLGMLEGGPASGSAFGYFSDFNTLEATASTSLPAPCVGNAVQFSAETIASATYNWSGPNGFISNLQNPVINNVNLQNSGSYILNVSVLGCGNYIDTVKIAVKSKPFLTVNQTICQGQAYLGYNKTGQYTDTFTIANSCDSIRTLNLIVKPISFSTISQTICQGQSFLGHNTSGIYIDTLLAANGCDSIRTLTLNVATTFFSTLTQSICVGDSFLGYNKTGLYIDSFKSVSGCDSIRYLNLMVIERPLPNLGNDSAICANANFFISPGKFVSYLWQDGSTLDHYEVSQPGLYSVTVTNICGSAKNEIVFSEKDCTIYFPNAFSPNNDSRNEVFKALNYSNLGNYHLRIYNRWGGKVFETNDYLKGWDGNLMGKPAEVGNYIWYCDFTKAGISQKLKGSVLLIR